MKVSGTYPSLSRGVSQQPSNMRVDGQHGEQVNMWSDPVHGLSRRKGTEWEFSIGINGIKSIWDSPASEREALQKWASQYITVPFRTSIGDFQVTFPRAPLPAVPQALERLPHTCIVTKQLERNTPLAPGVEHVRMHLGFGDGPVVLDALSRGIAAWAQVGDYFLLVPKSTPFPAPNSVDRYDHIENKAHAVLQVTGGVPNVEYSVTLKLRDGSTTQTVTGSYSTPSSAYSGALDTSGIEILDGSGNVREEYSKEINDATNAYNSAVTAWITTSAQAAVPGKIAEELQTDVDSDKMGGPLGSNLTTYVHGNSVQFQTHGTTIIESIQVSDKSGSELIKAASMVVKSEAELPSGAVSGLIVKVQPGDGEEAFYVKAVGPDGKDDGHVWYDRVRWEECARTSESPVSPPWLYLRVSDDGQRCFLASNIPDLGALAAPDEVSLPGFSIRETGDENSNPHPYFMGRQVTAMGMYQDRLFLCAGGVVCFSAIGDYFNFYRSTVITVPDSDPVELYAVSGVGDTLRQAVFFDKSLILFGDKHQYSLDGTVPITPSTGALVQSGSIEDAVEAPPVVGGNLVFFGKRREGSTEAFQIAIGEVQDTTNYSGIGLQLSDYLRGSPSELLYISSPQLLLVRTTGAPNTVYVFRYIDQGGERLLDSWSRLEYSQAFGQILGMFYHNDAVHYLVWREAIKGEDGHVWASNGHENPQYAQSYGWLVYERQSLLPQVGDIPYLDSARSFALYEGDMGNPHTAFMKSQRAEPHPSLRLAFARSAWAALPAPQQVDDRPRTNLWLWGYSKVPRSVNALQQLVADEHEPGDVAGCADYAVVGLPFDAYVELTSPIRKDREGHPVEGGRLTVRNLRIQYRDTAGFTVYTKHTYGLHDANIEDTWGAPPLYDEEHEEYTARMLLDSPTVLATVPVSSGETSTVIGRDTKGYTCQIRSKDWLPVNLTQVSWTGQWFMNHQHV